MRSYSEPVKSGPKDRDLQQMSVQLYAIIAAGAGAIMGALAGSFMAAKWGWSSAVIPLAIVVMAVGVGGTFLLLVNRAGVVGSSIYAPSGKTTPRAKEYSYPESLAARGMYEDAVSAFELVIVEEQTTDPTPFLRIARIYRDQLERPEDAVRWFRRALSESEMHPGLAALTRKEIVELYRTKLDQPEKAAPMLARLAEELAGTPDGDWAAEELAFVKQQMREREGL